ncbi:MAG: hypothetical protein CL935_04880 [Deltaproteobacteria bacterium]|nr:hypothetical protein [Deltaproteobacteria bacterium]
MYGLLKALLYIFLLLQIIILPAYIWSILDRESYESFLLKGVSPLTQKSRNTILNERIQY